MKAIVKRDDLIPHGRQIKNLKLPKKLKDRSQITLSVSERLVVTGPAFGYEMNCTPIKWGTVKIPLKIWQNIVEKLVPVLHDEDISISAETFLIEIGGTKIENPHIRLTHPDKLALEIPVDAKPIEIVKFALDQDLRELRDSAAWATIREALGFVRRQIDRANVPLKKYGITTEDLAWLVARNMGIKDGKRFHDILFSRR